MKNMWFVIVGYILFNASLGLLIGIVIGRKLLIEHFGWHPLPALLAIVCIATVVSQLTYRFVLRPLLMSKGDKSNV
jgi:hypothetical protein